jgi:murein DD-endopeptidase MepM/ murein hydrolase activator NlpD
MRQRNLRFTAIFGLCAFFVLPAAAAPERPGLLDFLFPSLSGSQPDPSAGDARAAANRWVGEAPAKPMQKIEQIRPGDTLATVLDRNGVPAPEAAQALQSLVQLYNPRSLQVGQPVVLLYRDNEFAGLSLRASIERDVATRRDKTGAFQAEAADRPLTRNIVRAEGMIGTSLFRSGMAAGVPPDIMQQLIKIFSYDVDFQRDIQPGDSFEAAYEELRDDEGNLARTEPLLYGALTLSGRTLSLYRFDTTDGSSDYYTHEGASVRKALLRTPIDGARLTSRFGMRNHPILGYTRMHRGVDFGAASGTPIEAAGDGTVEFVGINTGYGKYIRLKHTDIYETAYGHMSRFAAGLHVGSHVKQGEVIGYVGMTGLATGPHLHYEVLVQKKQVNPISVKFPTGHQLAGTDLKRFAAAETALDSQLAALPAPAPAVASAGLPHLGTVEN